MYIHRGIPHQRGYGLGAIFAGLARLALPVFTSLFSKTAAKAAVKQAGRTVGRVVKKTALKQSRGFLTDVLQGSSVKTAGKKRLNTAQHAIINALGKKVVNTIVQRTDAMPAKRRKLLQSTAKQGKPKKPVLKRKSRAAISKLTKRARPFV